MKVIGLTGGIGSGKSAVSAYLEKKGYPVIDADLAAREAVQPGSDGLAALVGHFGDGILRPDGSLDRKWLGEVVFSDEGSRLDLNRILHGRIAERMDDLLRDSLAAGAGVVFLAAPLLIEAGIHERVDSVWLVEADERERVRRIRARDGISAEDAMKRIAAQMGSEEKRAFADVIIDNSGSLENLYRRIDGLLEDMGEASRPGPDTDTGAREP
ncbi:MAG: dephospho-CoA kinase [Clostridiales Family XIII bacterium]|jgi:dephospho-CoA kinase|nr:dephospho-CoA kinase [Clostridiales Family XIII bacterium]